MSYQYRLQLHSAHVRLKYSYCPDFPVISCHICYLPFTDRSLVNLPIVMPTYLPCHVQLDEAKEYLVCIIFTVFVNNNMTCTSSRILLVTSTTAGTGR